MICAFSHILKAQTIIIDSTFTTDAEIFPFNQTDTIFGLTLTGNITLNTDTSLVRIIFVDNNSEEYLLYEAYPYIVDDWDFEFFNEADETKYLNNIQPYSIKVQIVNSSFEFTSLYAASEYTDFTDSLQLVHKQAMEAVKVSQMNSNIQQYQMIWFTAETSVSQLTFAEKKKLFGENYNMLGLDYYAGGVYDPVPGVGEAEEESSAMST
ncbi:MAG: hypothetical protein HQ565_00155 [Bacteroidetes bacterium]|nr:hypothetical protein [Bacteroidota bacterium]